MWDIDIEVLGYYRPSGQPGFPFKKITFKKDICIKDMYKATYLSTTENSFVTPNSGLAIFVP